MRATGAIKPVIDLTEAYNAVFSETYSETVTNLFTPCIEKLETKLQENKPLSTTGKIRLQMVFGSLIVVSKIFDWDSPNRRAVATCENFINRYKPLMAQDL